MLIEGVWVSARQVAELALRLHRDGHADLAQALGIAVDADQSVFSLKSEGDRRRLLRAAEAIPGETLSELRVTLAKSWA